MPILRPQPIKVVSWPFHLSSENLELNSATSLRNQNVKNFISSDDSIDNAVPKDFNSEEEINSG